MERDDTTAADDAARTADRARSRRLDGAVLGTWLWRSLRFPFVFVYIVGLAPEVVAFWRIDPLVVPLCAAAFTSFALIATTTFGYVRALPSAAELQQSAGLAAGRHAFRAAVLSLAALLVAHGWGEGWPGMRFLGAFAATDVLLRALLVALAVGAAASGLLAIWRLDVLAGAPPEDRPA